MNVSSTPFVVGWRGFTRALVGSVPLQIIQPSGLAGSEVAVAAIAACLVVTAQWFFHRRTHD